MRLVSHSDNMKIVLQALLKSVKGILSVFLIVLLIWIMFGILGTVLFKERFGYCEEIDNFEVN